LYENEEFNISLGTKEMKKWLPRLDILTNSISIIYDFLAGKMIKRKLEET
jgi:hypothetical protein